MSYSNGEVNWTEPSPFGWCSVVEHSSVYLGFIILTVQNQFAMISILNAPIAAQLMVFGQKMWDPFYELNSNRRI